MNHDFYYYCLIGSFIFNFFLMFMLFWNQSYQSKQFYIYFKRTRTLIDYLYKAKAAYEKLEEEIKSLKEKENL